MKKMFFTGLAIALAVTIQSCGSKGWTPETKESVRNICMIGMEISYPDDANTICDCYLSKLVEKYPKADYTPDQNSAVLDECSADAKAKADSDLERQLNDAVNSIEEGINKLGEDIENAADKVKEKIEEKK